MASSLPPYFFCLLAWLLAIASAPFWLVAFSRATLCWLNPLSAEMHLLMALMLAFTLVASHEFSNDDMDLDGSGMCVSACLGGSKFEGLFLQIWPILYCSEANDEELIISRYRWPPVVDYTHFLFILLGKYIFGHCSLNN